MADETATTEHRPKLVLVDAYSLLFRAFFAGQPLTTSDNRPTGALYGFTNMLFSLLNTERPDAIVVCWDAPERTLRHQEFEAYKAHRPEVDSQLIAQMPGARALVEAFGIQSAEVPGYEADDLIGTLACKGAREGYAVSILTGDSDQLQLVGDGITVLITQRGVTDLKEYDAAAVQERYGVKPEQIPDWKGLVGDTSDNIPGVPGIGEKTATALLQQFGSLENVLAHVEEVTPAKARTALENNLEQARLSKRLATIECETPLDLQIQPYAPTPEDWQRLRELFIDLEFKSMLPRIPKPQGDFAPVAFRESLSPEAVFATQTIWLRSPEELADAIASCHRSGTVGLRVDTDEAVPMRAQIRGLAFAPSPEIGYYVSIREEAHETTELGGLFDAEERETAGAPEYASRLENLRPLLEDPAIIRVSYNAKLAEIVLERRGLRPRPFDFDVLVAAYLLNAGRSSYPLMDLVEKHLGVRLEAEDAFAPQENLAREAAVILEMVRPLQEKLAEAGMTRIFTEMEIPLIPVLAAMEETGVLVDRAYLDKLAARMASEIDALAQEIYALAGEKFDIGSTKQLQHILFEKLQLPTGKKTKTGYSTGADLLEQLAPTYEIARKILDYREVAKLKSTYADALPRLINPETGRIHTSLNQVRTSTGRLSSSDPNLQNIPVRSEVGREIRRTFIAPPGKVLLSCDYSQIELRLLAHITEDPALVKAFANDEDVHAATAATVFSVPLDQVTSDMRRQAKTINFAVIYGQSGFSLASTLGVDTPTANAWIKDYFARLPGVQKYVEDTIALAHRQKWVSTLMGRRRYLPEIDSGSHTERQFAERAAVNMPIQGTAADIMKLAMISVYDYLSGECPGGCTLLLQVHDELLFEVEEAMVPVVTSEIVRRMETAYPLTVRLRVDAKAGQNWAEMDKLSG